MRNRLSSISRKMPWAKHCYLRIKYFFVRFIIKRTYGALDTHPQIKLIAIPCEAGDQLLKGYYDVRLFNRKGQFLYGKTQATSKRGSLECGLDLMLFDVSTQRVRRIGDTKAWNWQQGCMLQWYGTGDSKIIYNDYEEEKDTYCCHIKDIVSGEELILPYPFYAASRNGEFLLTLNFRRLAKLRPDYGYFNHARKELMEDSQDGIWRIEVPSGDRTLIISLEQLKRFKTDDTMVSAMHKVNHIDISPSGERFMFLHRWVGDKGRHMRLITANCKNGKEMKIVRDRVIISHSCWHGDNEIISHCGYKQMRRYLRINEETGEFQPLAEKTLAGDGHPTVSPNGQLLLTDTYPCAERNNYLILCNLQTENCTKIARFSLPFKFSGENRVDLHPVWDETGEWIGIDSGYSGKRRVYLLNVTDLIRSGL
jgi:hypothetical protein